MCSWTWLEIGQWIGINHPSCSENNLFLMERIRLEFPSWSVKMKHFYYDQSFIPNICVHVNYCLCTLKPLCKMEENACLLMIEHFDYHPYMLWTSFSLIYFFILTSYFFWTFLLLPSFGSISQKQFKARMDKDVYILLHHQCSQHVKETATKEKLFCIGKTRNIICCTVNTLTLQWNGCCVFLWIFLTIILYY